MDTEKQRQRRCDDASLTESRNARSEQLLVVPTKSLTNSVWLGTSKAWLVFRYEISDLYFFDVACSSPSSTSAALFLFSLHLQPLTPPHREKPLAPYIFTESGRIFKNITHSISAGAITHNDTFTHASGQMV